MLWLVLTRTRYGVATLAVSMDEDGARLVGIETEKVFNLSMFASAFLAAVAGALISPIMSMTPEMWNMPLMKAFVVVVGGRHRQPHRQHLGRLLPGLAGDFHRLCHLAQTNRGGFPGATHRVPGVQAFGHLG